jgi:SAM-dependent methyltransferase
MPFRNGSFSTVVCSEVLEHIEDDVQALQEIARVLRPGGTLVITFPHRKAYFSKDDRFVHHYRRYEREEMEKLLRQVDLAPVVTRKVLGPLEKLTMIVAVTVFSALPRISFGGHIEGPEGMKAAHIIRPLFLVANRLYAGLAWLDGWIAPRCLASVLLMKAVKSK